MPPRPNRLSRPTTERATRLCHRSRSCCTRSGKHRSYGIPHRLSTTVLLRVLYQIQKPGRALKSLRSESRTDGPRPSRRPTLPENTPVSTFSAPSSPPRLPPTPPTPRFPLFPPAPCALLSSTSDHQTVRSSDSALKEIKPQYSNKGERDYDKTDGDQENREKGDNNEQSEQTGQQAGEPTSVIGIRDSFKRTVDAVGLDEGGDSR